MSDDKTDGTDSKKPGTDSKKPTEEPEAEAAEGTQEPRTLGEAAKELIEPFIGLAKTPRSLFGIYVSYLFEGLVYFGILTILGKYLSENVGLKDLHAGWVYSLFTGGITLSMLFLGGVADKIGVRKALLVSLTLLVVGRLFLAASGTFFAHGQGAASPMFYFVLLGLLVVVFGYGMYQPAAYAGVKQYTDGKMAAMGYAMIYGLMNLGAFFSGLVSPPVRQRFGITSVFWVYVGFVFLALLSVLFILTQRASERDTVTDIMAKKEEEEKGDGEDGEKKHLATLFTPAFIAVLVGLVGALVVVVALAITADPGPAAKALDKLKGAYGASAKVLELDPKKLTAADVAKAKVGEKLAKRTAEIEKHAAAIVPPKTLPKGTKVDANVFGLLRTQARAEMWMLNKLQEKPELLVQAVRVNSKVAKDVRRELRGLGVFYMAAAYRLVGKFDHHVLIRIQERQSLPSEKKIPVSEAEAKRIVAATGMALPKMFEALAADTEAAAKRLAGRLAPGGGVLALVLTVEARLLRESVALGGDKPSAAFKGLLIERFYQFGALLIKKLSPQLVEGKKEKLAFLAPGFAATRLASVAGFTEQMKGAADGAVAIPTGERIMRWSMRYGIFVLLILLFAVYLILMLLRRRPEHPFHDGRFVFFIFILIPVQTLFAHNWLTLPYYIDRAFGGTYVGQNFEFFANINPILIFFLAPFVAALTARRKVYNMMIWGTLVMAAPTFMLTLTPNPTLLITYIVLMSIGEAMWQPRFLQWVAEIAPEGQAGAYMGIAQFPWFLTKVVTGLYSGYFLSKYCPLVGPQNTEYLWFLYGLIAMVSPVALIVAQRWMSKGMREKAA